MTMMMIMTTTFMLFIRLTVLQL